LSGAVAADPLLPDMQLTVYVGREDTPHAGHAEAFEMLLPLRSAAARRCCKTWLRGVGCGGLCRRCACRAAPEVKGAAAPGHTSCACMQAATQYSAWSDSVGRWRRAPAGEGGSNACSAHTRCSSHILLMRAAWGCACALCQVDTCSCGTCCLCARAAVWPPGADAGCGW
jgi:hypothetical protein